MRALASAVLTAATIIMMPGGAKAETSAEQRLCFTAATPSAQKIAACSSVITNAPPDEPRDLARLYLVRGNVYLAQRDYDRALADFDAATKAEPTNYGVFNSRGLVFLRQKQLDRAIAEFDEAIRLNPRDAIPWTNRGDAFRDKGRFDAALQDYDNAIAVNPKAVEAYFSRAVTLQQKASFDFDGYLEEGRYEALAIAEYTKLLQLAPRNSGALSNRGRLYHVLRKYDFAIADFTQALEINPANPIFLRNRALSYRMLRQFDLAIADYRKALTLTQDADGRKLVEQLLAQLGAAA